MNKEKIQSALIGLAVGDALGVPVEFKSRDFLKQNPVTEMTGFGTYHQPAGTFSDDSSMAFCLAENIAKGFNIQEIADNFVKWYQHNYWTARGEVFDIGIATQRALNEIINGANPTEAGGSSENSNGNGALMRILPLLFYIYEMPVPRRFDITKQVSSITHAHTRSVICCFYYLEFAREILLGKDKFKAYETLKTQIPKFLETVPVPQNEIDNLNRLTKSDIQLLAEDEIQSSGYVLHTLEASIWCILNTNSYPDAVLKAVNLGEDTDTTACVTGGLAGLLYGLNEIPKDWKNTLVRKEEIMHLGERLGNNLK